MKYLHQVPDSPQPSCESSSCTWLRNMNMNTLLEIVPVIWKKHMKKVSHFYFKVQPEIIDTLYVLYGEIKWPEFFVQCKSARRHFGDSYSVCTTLTKN